MFSNPGRHEYGLESESKLGSILIANGKNLCFSFLIKINGGGWELLHRPWH